VLTANEAEWSTPVVPLARDRIRFACREGPKTEHKKAYVRAALNWASLVLFMTVRLPASGHKCKRVTDEY
jgi:hypothetical protein